MLQILIWMVGLLIVAQGLGLVLLTLLPAKPRPLVVAGAALLAVATGGAGLMIVAAANDQAHEIDTRLNPNLDH